MAREVKTSGRTVYLPDREEWEEVKTDGWIDGRWVCRTCGRVTTHPGIPTMNFHGRGSPFAIELCHGVWDRADLKQDLLVSAPTSNESAPPNDVPPGSLYPDHGHDMRAGPYALGTVEVSGFVEHEVRCSGCGVLPQTSFFGTTHGQFHFVPAPGGWRKCGEWR